MKPKSAKRFLDRNKIKLSRIHQKEVNNKFTRQEALCKKTLEKEVE